MILNDHESDLETLLQNSNDICNHRRNIQTLLIEISKIKNAFAPPMMGTNLKEKNNINNVRNFQ